MKLPVDELKANHIVHVILDGTLHYSVIRNVTENSVYLADPSLGNIVMTREKFSEIYTGHALVITDPNVQVNQTAEQVNNTDTSAVQPENLTVGEMENIKGKGAWVQVWVKGWFYSWYEWVYGWYLMVIPPHGITHSDRISFVWVEGWYRKWGWYRKIYGWHRRWVIAETLPWNSVRTFTPPWPRY